MAPRGKGWGAGNLSASDQKHISTAAKRKKKSTREGREKQEETLLLIET
jgi:hypothetical protein